MSVNTSAAGGEGASPICIKGPGSGGSVPPMGELNRKQTLGPLSSPFCCFCTLGVGYGPVPAVLDRLMGFLRSGWNPQAPCEDKTKRPAQKVNSTSPPDPFDYGVLGCCPMLTSGWQMPCSPDALGTAAMAPGAGVTVFASFTCPLVERVRANLAIGLAAFPGLGHAARCPLHLPTSWCPRGWDGWVRDTIPWPGASVRHHRPMPPPLPRPCPEPRHRPQSWAL